MLTRPGCFNGGIQCQQVGLLGNRANGVEDEIDVLAVTGKRLDDLDGPENFFLEQLSSIRAGQHYVLAGFGSLIRTVSRLCCT
ncbi:hypothetical protein D9M69_511860 [compost metagenome]